MNPNRVGSEGGMTVNPKIGFSSVKTPFLGEDSHAALRRHTREFQEGTGMSRSKVAEHRLGTQDIESSQRGWNTRGLKGAVGTTLRSYRPILNIVH